MDRTLRMRKGKMSKAMRFGRCLEFTEVLRCTDLQRTRRRVRRPRTPIERTLGVSFGQRINNRDGSMRFEAAATLDGTAQSDPFGQRGPTTERILRRRNNRPARGRPATGHARTASDGLWDGTRESGPRRYASPTRDGLWDGTRVRLLPVPRRPDQNKKIPEGRGVVLRWRS